MRSLLFATILLFCSATHAQLDAPAEPHTLPAWMQEVAWGTKPVGYTLQKRVPLHTNAFTGTWSVQKKHGRRFDFWSDKHRVVIKEVDEKRSLERLIFLDLAANIRMNAHVDHGQALFIVEDLHVPNVGYFREIWSDSVRITGRTENILGMPCQELLGTDGNNDTTYYWRTDQHPKLFADMKVWAPWLCREGELEYLTALCAEPAGACLRAQWPKRRFGPEAGSIDVLSITPGATPMPTITANERFVAERRFLWNNNSGIGRLPAWMRAYVSDLKPDTLPALYTPAPVKRDIPDNTFIGTFTAETPTMILGMPNKEGRDTTHRVAKYSYWADARRAVLIMDDPDDEGYLFYAVDLDADVVMASHNEMSGHVIPKLYISTLEEAGLKEFGRGLELDFTPQGHKKNILGRECELHTAPERFLSYFWFPKKEVLNPVFDMKNWMFQRMGQKMKDVMFFGVADKPMPMAVMGTHLTSYKPGKAKPPVVDLRYYRVRDERLERKRERPQPPVDVVEMREVTVEEMMRGEGTMYVSDPDLPPAMSPPTESARTPYHDDAPKPPVSGGSGTGSTPHPARLSPELEKALARTTNQFIGTATLRYTLTNNRGETSSWTVRCASDSTRMVVISRGDGPLPNTHSRAYLLDRKAGRGTMYGIQQDGSITAHPDEWQRTLSTMMPVALADTVSSGTRTVLGRTCVKQQYRTAEVVRHSWVDGRTPSLFHDVIATRRRWGGIEIILLGGMMTSTLPGMPMEVDYTYTGGDHVTMKVLELKPGPVDPKLFEITPASFR